MLKKTAILLVQVLFASTIAFGQNPTELAKKQEPKAKNSITISVEPALRFYRLMCYIENQSTNGLNCKNADKQLIKENYRKNTSDIELQMLIDSLLALPIYKQISSISKIYSKNGITYQKGKATFREAFNHLPNHCIPMNGGRPYTWVEFWTENNVYNIQQLINFIENNEQKIVENSIERCKQLLPSNCNMDVNAAIYTIIDGNRGSFQEENVIALELMNTELLDTTKFMNVLTHELHHKFYADWLHQKTSTKTKNSRAKVYLQFQKSFIMEGVAQQYNISNYGNEVHALLHNQELINELFTGWISFTRKMSRSRFPRLTYAKAQKEHHKQEMQLLFKYCQAPISDEVIKYRPSVIYYLSFHLYNAILLKEGKNGLMYAIENPDQLLKLYNNIHTEELLIPKIPEDVALLWENILL